MFAKKENIKSIDRLKKRSDFLLAQRDGQKWISKGLIVEIRHNEDKGIRFGLTVSKRVSKLAVRRNLVKRRLRVAALEVLPKYKNQNIDIVMVGRVSTMDASFDNLKRDLGWCLKKMNVLADEASKNIAESK